MTALSVPPSAPVTGICSYKELYRAGGLVKMETDNNS